MRDFKAYFIIPAEPNAVYLALTTINKADKDTLLTHGCILVKDIVDDTSQLDILDCAPRKKRRIIQEAAELVHLQNS